MQQAIYTSMRHVFPTIAINNNSTSVVSLYCKWVYVYFRYLLDLSKEQEVDFTQKVKEIALSAGFSPTQEDTNDVNAVFRLQQ